MGDDTVDDEALARALNATAEEEAYEMGIEYPTFQPEKKRHRGDQGARKKQMSKCTADNTVVAKTEPEGAAQTTVTLAHLIDYAVLLPGPDVLTTRYCDETTTATLTTHGTIEWRHTEYRSLSAFSVAFKRTVKPGRMADDGWKSVRYLGRGKEDGETGTEGTEADPGKEAKDENTGVLLDVLKKRLIGDQSDLAKGVISGAGEAVRLMIQKIADEKKRTDAAKPKPPAKQPKPKTEKPPVKLKPVKPVKPSKPTPQPIDRPRRERKVPHRMGENLSDLTMVECASYDDDTKSKSNKQPFSIACSFEASALMDFHSHLSSDTEIIGFLAGKWCARTKMLSITKALPAKRLFSNDANVEVELDPASVPEICEKIELENEKVVGWYHSHPLFPTNPSLRDCENQANYQNLFKDQGETDESNIPFVGAIVGPYFGADPVAEITWFHIDENGFGDESLLSIQTGFRGVPKGLRCEYTQMGDSFGDGGVDELTQIQTQKKLERLKSDAFELCDVFGTGAEKWDRTELSKKWGATGFERTRLEKLCVSLRSRLPGSTTNDEIVSSVAAKMKQSWK